MASEIKEENNSTLLDVKNDESSKEIDKVDSDIKDPDKDSVKSEAKESGKEVSDDEDESDDEVALLDRPVEVTGCRARKKVERLEVSFTIPKEKQDLPEGKGKKLGDCPRIEAQILKMKPIDLKPMHKILYNRTGSGNEIKKNIRKFCGFPFEKDSHEYARKKAAVEKLTASILKQVCLVLDIERSGTKDEIVNRIMSFLLYPEDSGKKVSVPKKKASKNKKKSTSKKVKSEKKGKPNKDNSNDEDEDSVEEDDSTGGEASMGGTDEEAEALLTEPKKKSKETKKSKPKVEKGKKEDKKQKATKRKHDKDDDEKSSGSSDDEPAAKKSKMPSDEEISKLVKQILESADLQEITMKKVIKQVSEAYPEFDLSHKKAFIKSTIKSIL